jgi:hypothetical protein
MPAGKQLLKTKEAPNLGAFLMLIDTHSYYNKYKYGG